MINSRNGVIDVPLCCLAVSYHYNTSLEIHYSALGGSARPVQLQLQDSHRDVLLPDYRAAAAAMKKDHRDSQNPLLATFIEICEKLNGAHTLFAIYSSRLSHLPRNLVGPSVLAHEEFLDEFERSVGPYLSAVGGDASGAWWAHAPQPRPPSEEALRGLAAWPPEKHLILHRQHTASSSAANMFDDHLQGLSNALDRLGKASPSCQFVQKSFLIRSWCGVSLLQECHIS